MSLVLLLSLAFYELDAIAEFSGLVPITGVERPPSSVNAVEFVV